VVSGPDTNCTNGSGYSQLTAVTHTSWGGSGNPSGYAPLNVSWTVYASGGLPPYNITLIVNLSPGWVVLGHGATGHYTFTNPGIFAVDLSVRDSAPDCQHLGQGAFEADVWGVGGPNPVHITALSTNGTVPFHDSFTLTVVGLAGSFNVSWIDGLNSGGWGGTRFNDTFWMPASDNPVGACVYNATGALFACGVTYINVTGTGILQLSGSPLNATSPYTAHASVNLSRLDQIPGPAQLSCDWEVDSNSQSSAGSTPSWFNLTASPPAQSIESNSTLTTLYNIVGSSTFVASIVSGSRTLAVAYETFVIEPRNGSLPPPEPVLSYSVSPSSGTAPLTVTVAARANGGVAPYPHLAFGTLGAGSVDPNGSRAPGWWTDLTTWNGSTAQATHTFPVPGNFTIIGVLADGAAGSSTVLASVSVLAPAAPKPLEVEPRMVGAVSSDGIARFIANISGGTAPYSVQWTFGDGTLGSSVSNIATVHQFPGPGTYHPNVSVRDGRGAWANSTLPSVTIPGAGGSAPPGSLLLPALGWAGAAALVIGGACAAVPLWQHRHHRRLRREGQELIQDLTTTSSNDPSLAPPGQPGS
jgi:PKD repeat protein